jgi:hypothetical protein
MDKMYRTDWKFSAHRDPCDATTLIDATLADSYPGCGRGAYLRVWPDGEAQIVIDHGSDTDCYRAEPTTDEAEAITERDLQNALVPDDADLPFLAGVYGAASAITEADEDTTELCAIISENSWYGPNTTYAWVEDDRGDRIEGTYAEMAEQIEEMKSGKYCLSNNEASRPTYYIVEAE